MAMHKLMQEAEPLRAAASKLSRMTSERRFVKNSYR